MIADDISSERRDELVDWIARKIHSYRMEVPATAFLELSRPLMFIYAHVVHFLAPVADVLTSHPYASELGYLLQDRENLDRLLDRLEELAHQEDGPTDGGQEEEIDILE